MTLYESDFEAHASKIGEALFLDSQRTNKSGASLDEGIQLCRSAEWGHSFEGPNYDIPGFREAYTRRFYSDRAVMAADVILKLYHMGWFKT